MDTSNLLFVNVDTNYLKALHDADNEVQYSNVGYDEKPFIGILLLGNNTEYVIPLSSAKNKHLSWKDKYSDGRYLVTDIINRSNVTEDTIYKEIGETDFVKRIYASLDVKKMIPVKKELYTIVSFDIQDEDPKDVLDYKILQEKEYKACIKIFSNVSEKAKSIYDKQINTGKIQRFCCNFKLLEQTMKDYLEQED